MTKKILPQELEEIKFVFQLDKAPDPDFREMCEELHPDMMWLFDELIKENSARSAYWSIINVEQMPEVQKIKKEVNKNVRTYHSLNSSIIHRYGGGTHCARDAYGEYAYAETADNYAGRHARTEASETEAAQKSAWNAPRILRGV